MIKKWAFPAENTCTVVIPAAGAKSLPRIIPRSFGVVSAVQPENLIPSRAPDYNKVRRNRSVPLPRKINSIANEQVKRDYKRFCSGEFVVSCYWSNDTLLLQCKFDFDEENPGDYILELRLDDAVDDKPVRFITKYHDDYGKLWFRWLSPDQPSWLSNHILHRFVRECGFLIPWKLVGASLDHLRVTYMMREQYQQAFDIILVAIDNALNKGVSDAELIQLLSLLPGLLLLQGRHKDVALIHREAAKHQACYAIQSGTYSECSYAFLRIGDFKQAEEAALKAVRSMMTNEEVYWEKVVVPIGRGWAPNATTQSVPTAATEREVGSFVWRKSTLNEAMGDLIDLYCESPRVCSSVEERKESYAVSCLLLDIFDYAAKIRFMGSAILQVSIYRGDKRIVAKPFRNPVMARRILDGAFSKETVTEFRAAILGFIDCDWTIPARMVSPILEADCNYRALVKGDRQQKQLDALDKAQFVGSLASVMDTDRCICCGTVKAKKSLRKCHRCKMARYCTKECQVKDWPNHKEVCIEGRKHLQKKREKASA